MCESERLCYYPQQMLSIIILVILLLPPDQVGPPPPPPSSAVHCDGREGGSWDLEQMGEGERLS